MTAPKNRLRSWLACLATGLVLIGSVRGATAQPILYVNASASGANNGSSWADAFVHLQDAFANAQPGSGVTQIWVAAGTYRPDESTVSPTGTGDINATFLLIDGVALYGGFAGVEAQLNQRDFTTNLTVLSGDLGADDAPITPGFPQPSWADNCYHVVSAMGVGGSALLDGFIVTHGHASAGGGPDPRAFGAALFVSSASPVIQNCRFTTNWASVTNASQGAGVFVTGVSSNPLFVTSIVDSNRSEGGSGGACVSGGATAQFINCVLRGNSCRTSGGAFTASAGAASTLVNCTLDANHADAAEFSQAGGGIYVENATAVVTNCILASNTSNRNPPQIFTFTGNETVTVAYSLIVGGSAAVSGSVSLPPSVINADPLLVDAGTGDLHLSAGSPCIDAGSNGQVPADSGDVDNDGNVAEPVPDLDRTDRIVDDACTDDTGAGTPPVVDMGAYEFPGTQPPPPILYVNASATGANTGEDWQNALIHLQDAIALASLCAPQVAEIWVATGTYYPDRGSLQTLGDRSASFNLVPGVSVYGGFFGTPGTEGEFAQRDPDPSTNACILSGAIGAITNSDNSRQIVRATGTTSATVLDGFTIEAAYNDTSVTLCGAGILITQAELTLRNCMVRDNIGTGICIDRSPLTTIEGCIVSGNVDGAFSGGLRAGADAASAVTIRDTDFLFNSTGGGEGGAMRCSNITDLLIDECSYVGNSHTVQNSGGTGGVRLSGCVARLTGCSFISNSAGSFGSGGAMSFGDGGMVRLENSLFSNNTSPNAGAVFNSGSQFSAIGCTFIQNASGTTGGGAMRIGSDLIVGCSFYGNLTTHINGTPGGAIHAGGQPVLMNCVFVGNRAPGPAGHGGALFSNGTPRIINCVFVANEAFAGGAIYSQDQNPSSDLEVTNSILWGNMDLIGPASSEINSEFDSPVVRYCDIDAPPGSFGGPGNIYVNPLFVRDPNPGTNGWGNADDDYGDLRLRDTPPISTCIDAGDSAAVPADTADIDGDMDVTERVPFDHAGQSRFENDPFVPDTGIAIEFTPGFPKVVDMGAYEVGRLDCNDNDVPDECDVSCASLSGMCGVLYPEGPKGCGQSQDCNADGLPDDCQVPPTCLTCPDCNNNGRPDDCDAADPQVASLWIPTTQPTNWTIDDNWCPDLEPDNGAQMFVVTIPGTSPSCTLDTNPNISGLTIEQNGVLEVNANSGATVRTLVVEQPNDQIDNAGTIRARDGRRLLLDAADIVQTATGLLEAVGGPTEASRIQINGRRVSGGTARTTGELAVIELLGGAILENVTVEGNVISTTAASVTVPPGQTGIVNDLITNRGLISVGSATGTTATYLSPGEAGAVFTTDTGDGRVHMLNQLSRLGDFKGFIVNSVNHEIRGAGRIFGTFTNDAGGIVRALPIPDRPSDALIIEAPGPKLNNGEMRASANAKLRIATPMTNGSSGSITAEGNGTVQIEATVTGGGLIEAAEGTVLVQADVMQTAGYDPMILRAAGGTLRIRRPTGGHGPVVHPNGPVIIVPASPGLIEVDDADLVHATSWTIGNTDMTPGNTATMNLINNSVGIVDGDVTIRLNGILNILGSSLTAANLIIEPGGQLHVASSITLSGSLMNAATDGSAAQWSWNAGSDLVLPGGQAASMLPNSLVGWAMLEAASVDAGPTGGVDDFAFADVTLPANAHISLVDFVRNQSPKTAEAVYADSLTLEAGAVLNLNGYMLYVAGQPIVADVEACPCAYQAGTIENLLRRVLPGDVNGDGAANLQDLLAFLDVLLGLDGDPMHVLAADLDGNGLADGRDAQAFVELLLGG
ncbi:MAG: right-handed parallel beta-helix repeat-containing protein [Phycisphaerae bacterium]|nr:right-handed parallel beta-helix repeat-containing protein [Phycisphaerae bacterium]